MEGFLFEMVARSLLGDIFNLPSYHDPNIRRFSELKTNKERIEFVQNLAEQGRISLSPALKKDEKSSDRAEHLREDGNDMFRYKEYSEAHLFYNRSLKQAKTGSVEMAMAYGNRSAVLFEKGHYEECLQDIRRALECGYPADSYEKLLKRQKKARELKHKQKKLEYHDPAPEFLPTEKNETICSASNSVEIIRDRIGCRIVASKDIKMGEFIVVEKPFICTLDDGYDLLHCFGCLEICFNMIPCPYCSIALYCTEQCRTSCWNKYHKVECGILKTLHESGLDFWILPLRLTICSRDLYHKIDKLANKRSTVYRSDRYLEVYNLPSDEPYVNKKELWIVTNKAVAITKLLAETTDIFTTSQIRNIKTVFTILLVHNVFICSRSKFDLKKVDNYLNLIEIAYGIYPLLSVFRQSCDPNTVLIFYGRTAAVRTTKNIRKSQQVFIPNGYDYFSMSRCLRQCKIKNIYNYTCTCRACTEDWPLYHKLRTYKKNIITECDRIDGIIENIGIGDVETTKTVLNGILAKASAHRYKHPSLDWVRTLSLLSKCYSVPGNKNILL